jgi:hypothetical protein
MQLDPEKARSRVRSSLLLLAALAAAAPAGAEGWKLGFSVSESWNTNVRLAAAPSGKWATRFAGKLSKNIQGPRWQLGMSAAATKALYHGRASPRANGIFYGLGVQFGYQISPNVSVSIRDNFKSTYTGEIFEFVELDEDVLLPLTRQRRNHLRGSLAVEISDVTSFGISTSYDRALFQPDDIAQPRLDNGDRFATGLGLSRKLSDETSVNLGYSVAKSNQGVNSGLIHGVNLSVSHTLGEFTTMGVSLGGSRREGPGGAGYYSLGGGAMIARQFEDFSLSLSYRRDLSSLFGFGRDVVHNTFRLGHARKLSQSFGITVSGAYSRARDPDDPSFSYDAWLANAGFNLQLSEHWQLHAGYGYANRSHLPDEIISEFHAHRAVVQIGWNTAF